MTTIHNSTHQVTLTPKTPSLTITGTIDAIGPAGTYAAYTLQSAVFATAPTHATIKNTGTILSTATAGTDFGILLGGAGTITNTGLIKAPGGIFANGPATIKNAGTIKDLSNALIGTGIDMNAGGTLQNTATGLISAGTVGVFAGTGQITNAGTIKAAYDAIDTTGGADIANAGLLEGEIGIAASSGAHITNTGKILVSTTGVFLDGSSVLNAGLISGGSDGILQFNGYTSVTNAAAGTISAKNQAVSLYAGTVHNAGLIRAAQGIVIDETGAATNTGTISVTGFGIGINVAGDTVQNAGLITVTGTGGNGVVLDVGDTLSNTGTILGQYHGIYITLYKSGAASAPGQITNAGLIAAAQPAYTDFAGTTLISAAILDRGASTITNLAHATISDTAGIGITVAGYKTFGAPAAIYLPATILNAGTIDGADEGIQTAGALNLSNTGTIVGGDFAILAQGGGTIYNAGLIKNTDTAEPAIELDAGTNATSLLIIAPTSTIIGAAAVSGELSLATGAGTISFAQFDAFSTLALSSGADWQATGTISHQALITNAGTLEAGAGITLARGGTIENFGLITGGSGRVGATGLTVASSIYGKSNVIYNAGIIAAAQSGNGIELGAATTLVNAAAGEIRGFDGIVIAAGTVINDGTILAPQNGYAVTFTEQNAANRLILGTASDTQGYINLDSGTLELQAGTTTGKFSTRIAQMAAVVVDKHAAWALETGIIAATITNNGTLIATPHKDAAVSGTLTGTGTVAIESGYFEMNGAAAATQKFDFSQPGGTLSLITPQNFSATIEHFTLGDTIDLAGISLSSITATHFVAGTLTLSEATTSLQFTFANPAAFTGKTFVLSAAIGATVITLAAASPNLLPTPTPTSPAPLITLGS